MTADGLRPFRHDTLPQRVRMATGSVDVAVAEEVEALGGRRVMVIASEREAHLAARATENVPVAVRHQDVVMHVPVELAERTRAEAADNDVDVLLSIGGGSSTGLAKAVALTSGLPIIAVPTTYAGSEATDVWGLTEGQKKTTGSDPRVLPKTVIYDAELTTSLPVDMSVASGLNAVAHCVDSMWAPRADPINGALALESVRALTLGLPEVADAPTDLVGRERTLYGAYLAAVAFASAGSGLHHKICHVLGGKYDLPHAQTHAVVLPHVLAFNAPYAPEAQQRLADAFGAESAVGGLEALRERIDAPRALRDFGFERSEIPAAVEAIMPSVPADNPRPVTEENLAELLLAAWRGTEES